MDNQNTSSSKMALETEKAEMSALNKCISVVVTETGWTRDEARQKIKESMKILPVQYKDYVQMELFSVPLEDQKEYYERIVSERSRNSKAARLSTAPSSSADGTSTTSPLTKSEVCRILGLPFDGIEEEYSLLREAKRCKAGDLAFLLSHYRRKAATEKATINSEEDEEELAKVAFANGAKCVLCTKPLPGYHCLVVNMNLFDAATKILRHIREKSSVKCVEVTGSYGKTTTMNMLESMLEIYYHVYGHQGKNCNTPEVTIPRVQRIPSNAEIFLQEASEAPVKYAPGYISDFIRPDISVITSVGSSHIAQMGSKEAIADSCFSVQDGMTKSGVLVLNGDDTIIRQTKPSVPAVYYGIENPKADFCGINIVETQDGICFDVLHEKEYTPVRITCIGRHNVSNALGAFAVGVQLGLTKREVADGLSRYRTRGIRQNLVNIAGFRFYLDCYNASVESMKSALDTLSSLPIAPGGRRIAVLADIKEAGKHSREFHEQVGEYVSNSKVDILVCFGHDALFIAEKAKKKSGLLVYSAASHAEIAKILKSLATHDDVILLKGSHSMALEKVPDLLVGTSFHDKEEPGSPYRNSGISYIIHNDHANVKKLLADSHVIWIPDYVKDIPVTGLDNGAFESSEATSVALPTVLISIREAAFRNMKKLKTVDFPKSLKMIEKEAFANCISLSELVINDGCLYIGSGAFRYCADLKTISIPASVVDIADDAFAGCDHLTVLCPRGSYAEDYCSRNGIKVI